MTLAQSRGMHGQEGGAPPPTPLRLRGVPRPPQPVPMPTAPLHPGSLPRQLRQNPPLEWETPPATPPLPVAHCPCLAECLLYTRPCSHHRPRVAEGRAASLPRPHGRRGQGEVAGTTACSVPPGAACVWVHRWRDGQTDRWSTWPPGPGTAAPCPRPSPLCRRREPRHSRLGQELTLPAPLWGRGPGRGSPKGMRID